MTPNNYKIITGDFSAKIGAQTKEEDFKSMGSLGIGERYERGNRLIKFVKDHKLITVIALLQKPTNRYWTWESPDVETRNQIDFTLSNQRGIVTHCEVTKKADI